MGRSSRYLPAGPTHGKAGTPEPAAGPPKISKNAARCSAKLNSASEPLRGPSCRQA